MGHDRFPSKKVNSGFLCLLLCFVLLCGCGKEENPTKVVLTTGLARDEVFRIESISCSEPEIMVYLTNLQNQYENVYGEEIWDTEIDGESLETNVKDNALAKMAQVKTMNLMADDMGIELSQQELKTVETAADAYYDSLNNTEISLMGINRDTIVSLYREYMRAKLVYEDIIKDINPEVSDDEARNITLQQILIKTYTLDGSGKKVSFSDNARDNAYARIEQAHTRALEGEDFDSLVAEYDESEESTLSVGKSDLDTDYIRNILFNLANDEISPILTTDEGYVFVKCISTYDQAETDLNKVRIVENEKEEVFGQQYDAYVEGLTRMLNDSLWDSISFIHDPEVTTSDFFEVADEYL